MQVNDKKVFLNEYEKTWNDKRCNFIGNKNLFMKTLVTLSLILCVGLSVQAQKTKKLPIKKVEVEKIASIVKGSTVLNNTKQNSVARLYLIKNANIIKALSFETKANKAKLV
ncbi:hypothetical protein JM80_2074 [Cellulophaga sp. RHA_52]|uniref:Uncharacterized protein n=2 Tax=Flavobacteriaceae TaxID=49546 RepID=F0RFD8_CELLC|nr:hypothetical protein Celly_0045 [Cellulophaga lytica DSM 7489]TVZ09547.1 hypothetical protein JM80_2074 [Cellulophaga sp. RHA_52]SNQ43976.1 conserved exported hypothetical protein [Cellulophaga lytica]